MTLRQQALSYIAIGIIWNIAFLLLFAVFTGPLGTEPKSTMTVLFAVGVIVSFSANRQLTFKHKGHIGLPAIKFLATYGIGYVFNLIGLWLLVDQLHWAAWFSQVLLSGTTAVFLFASQRIWVFVESPH